MQLQSFWCRAGLVKRKRTELRHEVAGAGRSKVLEDIEQLVGETGDVSEQFRKTLTVGTLQLQLNHRYDNLLVG